MAGWAPRASLAVILCVFVALSHAVSDCPVQYTSVANPRPGGLLFGGVLNVATCRTSKGQPCPRSGYWADMCKMPTSSQAFGVCGDAQRDAGLRIAERLRGGEAFRLSPCDLWTYLRGRTLWLIGDSHGKQLYKSLQCFLFDFWDGKDCRPTASSDLVKALDDLPWMPGESKCFTIMGGGRICKIGAVLGTSLVNSTQVANGGVLNTLRDKGIATPNDIFVIQFGTWHMLEGPPGLDKFKNAVAQLGADFQRTKAKWPHVIWRETPMTHDKDKDRGTCRAAPSGWGLDYGEGKLFVQPNTRSDAVALLARGGLLNAPARDILGRYGLPVLGGFAYSVPLHVAHPALRGTSELDCLHYCSFGLPELILYELARELRGGIAGVKPLPYVPPEQRAACPPAPSWL
ncbi:MAG: hypothetical protein J3K34DRAFT_458522 [Monoraphidium minutum]|nr:MAG: hypothetical protein J3K34DRAFT_458522 [Monoraphidium minutum]